MKYEIESIRYTFHTKSMTKAFGMAFAGIVSNQSPRTSRLRMEKTPTDFLQRSKRTTCVQHALFNDTKLCLASRFIADLLQKYSLMMDVCGFVFNSNTSLIRSEFCSIAERVLKWQIASIFHFSNSVLFKEAVNIFIIADNICTWYLVTLNNINRN